MDHLGVSTSSFITQKTITLPLDFKKIIRILFKRYFIVRQSKLTILLDEVVESVTKLTP